MESLIYLGQNGWGCTLDINDHYVVIGEENGKLIQEHRYKCLQLFQSQPLQENDIIDVCIKHDSGYKEHECTVTSVSGNFVYLRVNKDINKNVKNLIKKNYGY